MKKIFISIISILMLFNGISAFAWGPKGHDVVAEIASRHISKKTAARIDKILEGKTMVYYSSWMDGIKGIPEIILFAPDGTIIKRGLRGKTMKALVEEKMNK